MGAAPDISAVVAETDDVLQSADVKVAVPVVSTVPPTKGFLETFGYLGFFMVFIFLLSTVWTLILADIQVEPTKVANRMMNSSAFDGGEFWLLPDPDSHVEVLAVIMLVLFALGYVGLVAMMLFPSRLCPDSTTGRVFCGWKKANKPKSRDAAAKIQNVGHADNSTSKSTDLHASRHKSSLAKLKFDLQSPDGALHQYYAALLDIPKLIFQTTTLFTYLQHGFPVAIVYIYTVLLLVNWLISSYRYQSHRPDPHLIVARVFYSFDLFFAVFAPLEVLIYSYYNFDFDRAVFATKTETLTASSYDRMARLFADPAEISVFRIAFHYLQFDELGSLAIKAALNFLSIYKWRKTIVHLIQMSRRPSPPADLQVTPQIKPSRPKTRRWSSIILSGAFFLAGVAVFIYSIVAVQTTKHVCNPHPECVVASYQWNVGSSDCSCLVFVDRDLSLKTFADWQNPPDATSSLAVLAKAGHLRIVQVINREVAELPIELRGCHHLEQLILIYTKTRRFPDWAKEFTKLEYLHIEGDFTSKQLTYLPSDLFVDMSHLTFIHFGSLVSLPRIPDLSSLHKLRYVTLAVLHSVTELPSFDGLTNLMALNIIDAIKVTDIPSLEPLDSLRLLMIAARSPVCCNGHMTATCILADDRCKPRVNEPTIQCTTNKMSDANVAVIKSTYKTTICPPITYDIKDGAPTALSTDGACGGVKYKQCTLRGMVGICYNIRMMVIVCDVTKAYENMRRLQIARGVGDPCDPTIEAWLGCTAV